MAIRLSGLLGKKGGPGFLGVVQDEGNKLDLGFFGFVAGGIGLADGGRSWSRRTAPEQGEKVLVEDETQDQQDDGAADTDVHATKLKTAATVSAARFVAAVFNVLTLAARGPFHVVAPWVDGKGSKKKRPRQNGSAQGLRNLSIVARWRTQARAA